MSIETKLDEGRVFELGRLAIPLDSILSHFAKIRVGGGVPPATTIRESIAFFNDLGSEASVFQKYPSLLTYDRSKNLEPKLSFFVDEIGISRRVVARSPELFTYSLDSMQSTYQHYVDQFGGNKEQARALLRVASTVFGNNTALIDNKIRRYVEEGIDFHRNYILLEINPEKAIETRRYLTELGVQESKTGMWCYYMLLALSRGTLEPKVVYCEKEGIEWRSYPTVLILGLGTETKLGALPRRVNMIKNEFQGTEIPKELDYSSNPHILDLPDTTLWNRVKRHR